MIAQNKPHVINPDESVISIKGLYKSFGDLDVLKGVDLDVYKGDRKAHV